VQEFSCFLETHGGDAGRIEEVCQDMSEAYLAGTLKHLPAAALLGCRIVPTSSTKFLQIPI